MILLQYKLTLDVNKLKTWKIRGRIEVSSEEKLRIEGNLNKVCAERDACMCMKATRKIY